ncbi:MAG TPA: acyl carrier protein [Yinghuangia sp.]|uniref:acyl carrier protein n=1 Tax=Yinghuangia sp. YIM S10712 TaxID=3436930 RepID=UPI002C674917|nr:acyl carrier protein [Yinghuangia sp.]
MNAPFGYEELSALMKATAGVAVDPLEMAANPESGFADFGLDSLGLMAVVAEIEHNYGTPLGPDAENRKTPREFVDLVNSQLTSGV